MLLVRSTGRLLRSGRTRVAFLAFVRGDITESTHLRLLGYQEALLDAGVELDPALVLQTDGLTLRFGGLTAVDAVALARRQAVIRIVALQGRVAVFLGVLGRQRA